MVECPLRKAKNIERVSTLEFVAIIGTKSLEFQNAYEIRSYDDCEQVAMWLSGLSKLGLMGIGN